MMKVLLLAAGYGARLQRELADCSLPDYEHLIGLPKPLLPIGGVALITRWMNIFAAAPCIDTVYIVVNETNYKEFLKWSKNWQNIKLVSDGSTSNENRIGAVGSIQRAVAHFEINEQLVITAGDTLFYKDFSLSNVIQKFENFQKKDPDCSLVLYTICKDDEVSKRGILETDSTDRVQTFMEKPQHYETRSRKACPCFYILSQSSLRLLTNFLEEFKNEPLKNRDATGHFIRYLYQRMPVYATQISGRFDVGGLESYIHCDNFFKDNSGVTT